MSSARLRLGVAAVALAAWIGFLGYLAFTTTRPVVLSRPQFLAADAYVLAELEATGGGEPSDRVRVREVYWSKVGAAPQGDAPVVTVVNLPRVEANQGWTGSGTYVLALSRDPRSKENSYLVTPIPRSPMYGKGDTPIYPESPRVLRQVEILKNEFHGL
jgi:hypothetical protein